MNSLWLSIITKFKSNQYIHIDNQPISNATDLPATIHRSDTAYENQNQTITPMNRSVVMPALPETPLPDSNVSTALSDHRAGRSFWSEMLQDALLPYLWTRIFLIITGLIATFYLLPLASTYKIFAPHMDYIYSPAVLWRMWQRFDSGYYMDIARHGYWSASTLHNSSNWVFYPFYPLLIACLNFFLGNSETGAGISALIITNGAAFVAVGYFYALIRQEFSRETATRAVLYLALFPMAFYLSAIYTESLFLMLAVMTIYYARRHAWWRACICGAFASLTRSQGLLLIVPLAWEYLQMLSLVYAPQQAGYRLPVHSLQDRLLNRFIAFRLWCIGVGMAAREWKNWLKAFPLLLLPVAYLLFMLYAKMQTGDFFATMHTNAWSWGRQFSAPWRLLIFSLRHPLLGDPMNWNFWLLNMVMVVAFFIFTYWSFRRLPMIYALYTLFMVLLPLCTSALNSVDRFYLIVFPAFILLALWTQKGHSGQKHSLLIAGFAALQALLMVFFILVVPTIS